MDAEEYAPAAFLRWGRDLVGSWQAQSPDVQQAWRGLQADMDGREPVAECWRCGSGDVFVGNPHMEHVAIECARCGFVSWHLRNGWTS